MKIQISKTILILATGLTLTPFANAQFKAKEEAALPPQSMIGLPGASRYGTDPLHLLQTEKVKKELKITDEQSAKLSKVADKYDREAAAKLGTGRTDGLSAKAVRDTGDKIIESSRQEVSTILNADQLNRLKQILMQVNGAEALRDKEVAKEVGFSAEESTRLQKLMAQNNDKLHGSLGLSQSSDPNQSQKLIGANIRSAEKIDSQTQEQYLSALTPEQKKKLAAMSGAPFTLQKSDVVGK
jgi:Spy/CpxP family protein refolding chaperone